MAITYATGACKIHTTVHRVGGWGWGWGWVVVHGCLYSSTSSLTDIILLWTSPYSSSAFSLSLHLPKLSCTAPCHLRVSMVHALHHRNSIGAMKWWEVHGNCEKSHPKRKQKCISSLLPKIQLVKPYSSYRKAPSGSCATNVSKCIHSYKAWRGGHIVSDPISSHNMITVSCIRRPLNYLNCLYRNISIPKLHNAHNNIIQVCRLCPCMKYSNCSLTGGVEQHDFAVNHL